MARILVVDDNQTNLDLIVYLLHAFGHAATGVSDAFSGLHAAQTEDFDLILTDILMPGIDGFEFARRYRNDSGLQRGNLVAVTALAMVGDRERVLSAGFDGYISKPIEPETFVSQVDEFLPPALRSLGVVRDRRVASGGDVAPTTGATILIVDDVRVNIEVLRGVLQPFGYRIRQAHDAPSAIEACVEAKPDLVLCDLHMAGGDGFLFITELKARADLRAIPVLFISSTSRNTTDKIRALELGAVKFLIRPIEPRHLLTEVKEALKG